jgi:3-hydroxyisobutyrate dehydrogenase-like beta-hydroxyacid dehydrogenase
VLKILGNSLIFRMVEAIADGMVVAEKTGLGTDELHRIIELLFPGPFLGYSNRMISGDYYQRDEPLFAVDLARKDVAHMLDLGESVGAKLKAVEVLDESLKAVKAHAGVKGDIAGLYGAARQNAGLEYKNQK